MKGFIEIPDDDERHQFIRVDSIDAVDQYKKEKTTIQVGNYFYKTTLTVEEVFAKMVSAKEKMDL